MGWVQPSVGVHVHYVSHGSPILEDGSQAYSKQCRAATVTEVIETSFEDSEDAARAVVSLCVMNPTGIFFTQNAHQHESPDPDGGTWHWRCGGRYLS